MALVTDLDLPFIEIFGDAFAADPHGAFAEARRQHWLARSEIGYHLLTFAGTEALLRDKRFRFGTELGLPPEGEARETLLARSRRNLLNLRGTEHTRLRRLVSKAFTPRAVEHHRSHVREVFDGLLDPVCERGRCEFVHDVTEPYPVMVICQVLGTPTEDWKRFSDWVEILFSRLGLDLDEESTVRVMRAQDELDGYLADLVDRRRSEGDSTAGGGDLLGALIAVEEDGDSLATAELVTLMENILSAGTDTTRNQLATAVALFAEHPDQLALLAEDQTLIEGAVEEVLRFAPVVAGTLRVATEPVEMDGVVFPEGTMVSPTMAAANRDPAVYPDPDRFDVTRAQPGPHLSFGGGAHFCLGAALARLELVEGFRGVVQRLPDLRPDGEVRWKSPVGIGGPSTLPIAFTAGG